MKPKKKAAASSNHAKQPRKVTKNAPCSTDCNDNDSVGSLDIGACCLCHCALDYSDRAAFFPEDRQEDYDDNTNDNQSDDSSYFFRPHDPYLPTELYHPDNALLYCDSCDRMYHQQCHFVPVWNVPRGAWHCLYCQSQTSVKTTKALKNSKKKTETKKKQTKKQRKQSKKTEPTALSLPGFFHQLDAADPLTTPTTTSTANHHNRDWLFRSPPVPSARVWELRWEQASAFLKATTLHKALQQLQTSTVPRQLSTLRRAQEALHTITTTTKPSLQQTNNLKQAQEIQQLLVQGMSAKYKLRRRLLACEDARVGTLPTAQLQNWIQQQQPSNTTTDNNNTRTDLDDFVQRVLYPFGRKHEPRTEPRTAEFQPEPAIPGTTTTTQPPNEIAWMNASTATTATTKSTATQSHGDGNDKNSNDKKQTRRATTVTTCAATATATTSITTKKPTPSSNDNDSGISLDHLTCSVCFGNKSTDDNDLVLCDGAQCFRAYHQHCVHPPLLADLEEMDDWFCPLCQGIADLLHLTQSGYMGEEWEQRRMERDWYKAHQREEEASNSSSLQSWDQVQHVFPTAQADYEAAVQLRDGIRNAATDALVERILGKEAVGPDNNDDDDDDEEEDGHFDLEAFQEQRKQERAEDKDGDDSSHSSQATLVDMSSVEYEIDRKELEALSEEDSLGLTSSDDEADEDGGSDDGKGGWGRRLRSQPTATKGNGNNDPGKLDKSNIIRGKRRHVRVDYVRLNEAIFGDMPEDQVAKIDGGEEFKTAKKRTKEESSDNSEDSSDDDSSGSDDDDSSSNDSKNDTSSSGSGNESSAENGNEEGVEKKVSRGKKKAAGKQTQKANGKRSSTKPAPQKNRSVKKTSTTRSKATTKPAAIKTSRKKSNSAKPAANSTGKGRKTKSAKAPLSNGSKRTPRKSPANAKTPAKASATKKRKQSKPSPGEKPSASGGTRNKRQRKEAATVKSPSSSSRRNAASTIAKKALNLVTSLVAHSPGRKSSRST